MKKCLLKNLRSNDVLLNFLEKTAITEKLQNPRARYQITFVNTK